MNFERAGRILRDKSSTCHPTPSTGVLFSFSLASQKCTKASARELAARFKVCRKSINTLQQLFTVYEDVG